MARRTPLRSVSALLRVLVFLIAAMLIVPSLSACDKAKEITQGGANAKKKKGPADKHVTNAPVVKSDAQKATQTISQTTNYLISIVPPPKDREEANTKLQEKYKISFPNNDPWGRPYEYKVENGKPIVFSVGLDGKAGTADDITPLKDKVNRQEVN